MNNEWEASSRMRAAFENYSERALPGTDCPAPERIWEAASGHAGPNEVTSVVLHTTGCPACAESWRLASACVDEGEADVPMARPRRGFRLGPGFTGMLATAAAIVIAILVINRPPYPLDEGVYRESPQPTIDSRIDGQVLGTGHCLLRWAPPEGRRVLYYQVLVLDENLQTIVQVGEYDQSEFLVPAKTLAEYSQSQELNWKITAMLEGGGSLESRTFTNELSQTQPTPK